VPAREWEWERSSVVLAGGPKTHSDRLRLQLGIVDAVTTKRREAAIGQRGSGSVSNLVHGTRSTGV
jgi:hypothetical protein